MLADHSSILISQQLNERVAGVTVGSGAQGATIQISSVQSQQVRVTSYE